MDEKWIQIHRSMVDRSFHVASVFHCPKKLDFSGGLSMVLENNSTNSLVGKFSVGSGIDKEELLSSIRAMLFPRSTIFTACKVKFGFRSVEFAIAGDYRFTNIISREESELIRDQIAYRGSFHVASPVLADSRRADVTPKIEQGYRRSRQQFSQTHDGEILEYEIDDLVCCDDFLDGAQR